MSQIHEKAQLHCFDKDTVAVKIGAMDTIYITRNLAENLADNLLEAVYQLKNEGHFKTVEVKGKQYL